MKWSVRTGGVVLACGVPVILAGWLGGSEAAAGTLAAIGVSLAAWYGAGWGGDQATETNKYRRSLLAGDKMPSANDPLTPDPGEVGGLISELVSNPWPENVEDRLKLFSRLGFDPGEPFDQEHPSVTSGRFHAKLLGSPYGVWAAIDGGLLSLNIFLYSYLRPGRSAAELGFSALTVDLMERFGPSSDAGEAQRDIYWALNGILLEVHHDLAGDGMVQVSMGHAGRNEDYEVLLTGRQD